eukprot:SAG31_NODE_3458_length_4250_cov_1.904601_2_plen_109_part_00
MYAKRSRRCWPRQTHPKLAGSLTGILIAELQDGDLLQLLNSPEKLKEAFAVALKSPKMQQGDSKQTRQPHAADEAPSGHRSRSGVKDWGNGRSLRLAGRHAGDGGIPD